MASIYTTMQGDTWDKIAKSVYNDETKIGTLMEHNLDCLGIFIFDSGTNIYIPNLEEEEETNLPDWRYDDEEEESDE